MARRGGAQGDAEVGYGLLPGSRAGAPDLPTPPAPPPNAMSPKPAARRAPRGPSRTLVCALVVCALLLASGDIHARLRHAANAHRLQRRFGNILPRADAEHTLLQKAAIIDRLRAVLRVCGTLCNTNRSTRPGPFQHLGTHYFAVATAPVPCRALYATREIDAPRETKVPPREIPSELKPDFTMGGRVDLRGSYYNNAYLGTDTRVLQWTTPYVEELATLARKRILRGNYGVDYTNKLQNLMSAIGLNDKRVLVIGSENPWVEACALVAGAREVVTLEYSRINVTHPGMSAMLPREFADAYLAGTLRPFDVVVTFSSLEHPGLGRYGDALNPWGDILAVAKAWCVTKSGGKLIIQVPYESKDAVVFNAHRIYGPVRTPYLMANWKQARPSKLMADPRVYDRMPAQVI